jgi:uncharacterized protein (UPF0332 family)
MFYAAHAALPAASGAVASEFKTHNGLIAAFGKEVILGLKMSPALGQAINKVQKQRQLADYIGDQPPFVVAIEAVAEDEIFVAAIQARFPEFTELPKPRRGKR